MAETRLRTTTGVASIWTGSKMTCGMGSDEKLGVLMALFIGKVGRREGGWGVVGGSDEGTSRLVGGGVRGGGGNEEPPLRAREDLTVDHCEIPWVWRGWGPLRSAPP